MKKSNKCPILITGSHRSGSTWVGKMISFAPAVGYMHEPFNPEYSPRIFNAKSDRWFHYICDENELLYLKAVENCLRFKFQLSEELKFAKSFEEITGLARNHMIFTMHQLFRKRALVKDPIAIFSAEWLARRFNMEVLILIRHPAAFVGSLKQAGWTHPFNHFLEQPLLMAHHLHQYTSEIESFSRAEKDIVSQGILLWNLINSVILKFRENNPSWLFVKHEDLSRDPLTEFRKLYERLDLDFSEDVQEKIKLHCFSKAKQQNLDSLKRHSASNIASLKKRLTHEEICRIKEETHKVASEFYTEEDWILS